MVNPHSAGLNIKGADYPFLPYMADKRKNTKNRAPRQKEHKLVLERHQTVSKDADSKQSISSILACF